MSRAGSFKALLTYFIVGPTCFLLGILFTNWPYDFPLLWTSTPLTNTTISAIEAHYTTLYNSPPLIPRVLHFTMLLALSAFCLKLYKPSESNALFDGASLALFMIAVIMWGTNVIRGMQSIATNDYGEDMGKAESMQVLAATNTIMALVLLGVLTLQAGQAYAEKKEREELEGMKKEAADKNGAVSATAAGSGSVGRKKGETVVNGGKKKKV